jgi:WD40 repeat protein
VARVWDVDTHRPLSPLDQAGRAPEGSRFAVFSPDGRLVLTANAGHAARVWDAETGRPVTPAFAVGGPLKGAALTADGRHAVTLTEDGQARLWAGEKGQPLPGLVRGVGFSPDGRLVMSIGDDQQVRLWESATGQLAAPPLAHPNQVWHASFSPDGRRLATTCWLGGPQGGEVRLWSCDKGELLGTLPQPNCSQAFFSPDGKRILTVVPTTVRLAPVAGGAQPVELPHQGVYWAGFSPDGASVLTAAQDMTARLWDAATSTEGQQAGGGPLTPVFADQEVQRRADPKVQRSGSRLEPRRPVGRDRQR